MTWDDWVTTHRQLFGWQRDDLIETLVRWAGLFSSGGYTPEEMRAASEWVALHDPPRFADGHLRSLLDAARAGRARRLRVAAEETRWSDCGDCGGSGLVPVPSWKPAEGRWGEACCACTCAAGQRRAQAWEGYRAAAQATGRQVGPLTPLDVYDAERPDWRERLAAQRAQRAAELAAVSQAGGMAAAVGKVMTRLQRLRAGGRDG